MQSLQQGTAHPKYQLQQGILCRKGRVVVGRDTALQQQLINLMQDSSLGGHSGVTATTKSLASLFYWKGLNRDVRNHV